MRNIWFLDVSSMTRSSAPAAHRTCNGMAGAGLPAERHGKKLGAAADSKTGLIRLDGPAYDVVYSIEIRDLRSAVSRVRRPSYHEDVVVRRSRDGLSIRVEDVVADADVGEDVDIEPQVLGLAASEDEDVHRVYLPSFVARRSAGRERSSILKAALPQSTSCSTKSGGIMLFV